MAGREDHPAIKKVADELVCPICLETAQLPVNYTCFRGCGGRFSNNSTCLRSVLCMHCANDALQLGSAPPARFRHSGGFAHCLICRETRVDARMLTPDNAYMLNHNVMAIMDALGMGATCRRCEEDMESQSALHQHYLRRCPGAVVKCRFRGCAHWHNRRAAATHEETCPVGRAQCGQCGAWVDRTELLRHMVTTCRLRVVNCVLCKHSALLPDMLEHLRLHQSQLQGQVQAHARAHAETTATWQAAATAAVSGHAAAGGATGALAASNGSQPKPPELSNGAVGRGDGSGPAAGRQQAATGHRVFASVDGMVRGGSSLQQSLPSATAAAAAQGPATHAAPTAALTGAQLEQHQRPRAMPPPQQQMQQQQQQQQHAAAATPISQRDVQQQAQQLLHELLRRQQQQLLQRLQEQGAQAPLAAATNGAAAPQAPARQPHLHLHDFVQGRQGGLDAAQVGAQGRQSPPTGDLAAAAAALPAAPSPTRTAAAAAAAHSQSTPQWIARAATAAAPAAAAAPRPPHGSAAGDGVGAGRHATAALYDGLGAAHAAARPGGVRGISSFAIALEADGVSANGERRSSLEVPPPPGVGALGQARLSAPGPGEERDVRRNNNGRAGDGGGGGGSAHGGFSEVVRRREAFWPTQPDQSAAFTVAATAISALPQNLGTQRSGGDTPQRTAGSFRYERLYGVAGGGGGGGTGAGYHDGLEVAGESGASAAAAAAAAADEAARMVRTAAAIVRASAAASERRSHRQLTLTTSSGSAAGASGGAGPAMAAAWWGVAGPGPVGRSHAAAAAATAAATAAAATAASSGDHRTAQCTQQGAGAAAPVAAAAPHTGAADLSADVVSAVPVNALETSPLSGAWSRTAMDSAIRRSFSDTELVFDVLEELVRASSSAGARGAVRISASGV